MLKSDKFLLEKPQRVISPGNNSLGKEREEAYHRRCVAQKLMWGYCQIIVLQGTAARFQLDVGRLVKLNSLRMRHAQKEKHRRQNVLNLGAGCILTWEKGEGILAATPHHDTSREFSCPRGAQDRMAGAIPVCMTLLVPPYAVLTGREVAAVSGWQCS